MTDPAADDPAADDPAGDPVRAVAEALARQRPAEREALRAQVERDNQTAARIASALSGEDPDEVDTD